MKKLPICPWLLHKKEMNSFGEDVAGTAAGINNPVSRTCGLLAIAVQRRDFLEDDWWQGYEVKVAKLPATDFHQPGKAARLS